MDETESSWASEDISLKKSLWDTKKWLADENTTVTW